MTTMTMKRIDTASVLSKVSDMRDYVASCLGKQPEKRSRDYVFFFSPFRDDGRNPSFCVYQDHIYDYGSGERYDAISFTMKYFNLPFKEACAQIAGDSIEYGLSSNTSSRFNMDDMPVIPEYEGVRTDYIKRATSDIEHVRGYLESRAIDVDVAKSIGCGSIVEHRTYNTSDGDIIYFEYRRLTMPHITWSKDPDGGYRKYWYFKCRFVPDSVKVVGSTLKDMSDRKGIDYVKLDISLRTGKHIREITDKEAHEAVFHKWSSEGRSAIFNSVPMYKMEDGLIKPIALPYVLVTESETCTMNAMGEGYLSVAAQPLRDFNYNVLFSGVRTVFYVMDNDEAGADRARKWAIEKLPNKVRVIKPPEGFKDLNDLAVAGELSHFLDKQGIEKIVTRIS